MRTISRPEPPAITRIACGVITDGASRSRRPSPISTRVALGESWMPAPTSSSLAACSRTGTRKPARASASADVAHTHEFLGADLEHRHAWIVVERGDDVFRHGKPSWGSAGSSEWWAHHSEAGAPCLEPVSYTHLRAH